ncbi:MAG: hypothetical protein AABZ60_03075, partial [Planctomycetota bacterium]
MDFILKGTAMANKLNRIQKQKRLGEKPNFSESPSKETTFPKEFVQSPTNSPTQEENKFKKKSSETSSP